MQQVRGAEIALIFQEPMTALNPVFTIGDQIDETLRVHGRATRRTAARGRSNCSTRCASRSPARRVRDYPHQLSGGLRQRALIAMALACNPALLIADEPTTALDVTIQAQILELLRDLQARLGLALLLITHDLGVVAEMADRVAVMYAGRIVEEAPVRELFARSEAPLHARPARLDPRRRARHAAASPFPAPFRRSAAAAGLLLRAAVPERFEPCPTAHPGATDDGGGRTVKCYLHGPPWSPSRAARSASCLELLPRGHR